MLWILRALIGLAGLFFNIFRRVLDNENACALLTQLGIDNDDWLQLVEHFGQQYHQAVGSLAALNSFAAHTGRQWIGGHRQQSQTFH